MVMMGPQVSQARKVYKAIQVKMAQMESQVSRATMDQMELQEIQVKMEKMVQQVYAENEATQARRANPGADGSDGSDGVQGPQGNPGQDGSDGATGPQGIQGIQGDPGQDGAGGGDVVPADFEYTLVGSGGAVITDNRIAVDTGITGWDTYTKIAINFGASILGGTIGASRELETRILLELPASIVGQSQLSTPSHFIRLGGDAGDGGQVLLARTADNSLLFTSNNGIDVLPLTVYGITIIGVASSGERGLPGVPGVAGPASTTSIVQIGQPVNIDVTISNRFNSTGLIVPADAKWGRISLGGISDRRLPAFVLDFDIFRALPESIADTGGSNFVNSTTTIIIDTFSFNTFSLGRGANNELLFAASVATIDPMPLTLYRENTTDVTPGQDGGGSSDITNEVYEVNVGNDTGPYSIAIESDSSNPRAFPLNPEILALASTSDFYNQTDNERRLKFKLTFNQVGSDSTAGATFKIIALDRRGASIPLSQIYTNDERSSNNLTVFDTNE